MAGFAGFPVLGAGSTDTPRHEGLDVFDWQQSLKTRHGAVLPGVRFYRCP